MKKIVCLLLMIMVLPFQFTGCTGDASAVLAEADTYSYDTGLPADGRSQAEGKNRAVVASGEKSASGTVEAVDSNTISAPFGGLLKHLDVRRGDDVSKDDVLFELDTVKVYSPRDGSVTAVRAVPGDYAQTVQARYGALCYIEPDPGLVVNASVTGAYDKAENKTIHAGELLYVKNNINTRFTGEGGVIGINRDKFTVELDRGSLQNGDTVSLFRKDDYSSESRVGMGKVSRIDPVPVNSQGSVLKVHASEGRKVKKGDLLFEMVGGDLTGYGKENVDKNSDKATASINDIDNTIKAGSDGVLGDIFVTAGQPVQKDQPLAKLYAKSDMVVVAEVDEIDIGSLNEGDDVTIIFDGITDKSFEGNIETISGLGIKKQNASYFDVRISFEPDPKVRLGMSATVYFED